MSDFYQVGASEMHKLAIEFILSIILYYTKVKSKFRCVWNINSIVD